MSVFATMIAMQHTDPHHSDPAEFIPANTGRSHPIRVIRMDVGEFDPIGNLGVQRPSMVLEIQQAQIPLRPVEGDLVRYQGADYRIRTAEADPLDLIWRLDLDTA